MSIKRYLICIVSLLLLITTTGCFYIARYDGTYGGKIIDEATGEPLEGTVVLVTWYREYTGAAGSVHEFYDAKETVTGKNGTFEISGMGLKVLSNIIPMGVTIFKAGYTYYDISDKEFRRIFRRENGQAIIRMKKLTMEQRRKSGGPPDPPDEASFEKVRLMLKEINKDDIERGLSPRKSWDGHKIE